MYFYTAFLKIQVVQWWLILCKSNFNIYLQKVSRSSQKVKAVFCFQKQSLENEKCASKIHYPRTEILVSKMFSNTSYFSFSASRLFGSCTVCCLLVRI